MFKPLCMKKIILVATSFLALLVLSCEKENNDSLKNIEVLTGNDEYVVNSRIDVTLTNSLDEQAAHLSCDNADLWPEKILKYEDGAWVEYDYAVICTQVGSIGYSGVLEPGEVKNDTISMENETGNFKLRYQFVVDNDTLEFDSNEFLLYGLEL